MAKKKAVKETSTLKSLIQGPVADLRNSPDKRAINNRLVYIANTKDKAEPITRHPAMKELPIALQEGRHILILIASDEGMWFELA